ncbi:MAG: thioredoxin [Gemmatimonadetes bacterium]|nr:thioredoxin [Gemmatimonadota bacterium]
MPLADVRTDARTDARVTLRCASCGTWNRVRADRAADGPKCGSCGTAFGLDHPVYLDDDSFDRVILGTDIPVFVDFYADWCGPCKMMAPSVAALARETVGRVLVAKLDTDAAQRTAGRFQIRGIPTCIVFRGGREVTRQSGVVPLGMLRGMVGY